MMRDGKALKIRRGRISERRRRKLPQTSGKRVRLVMLASFAPLSIRSRVLKRNVQAHETERLAGRGGGLRGTPRSFFQPTAVRLKTNFVRRINVICPVQMAAQGCFALPAPQIKLTTHPSEGRLENVTDAGWDAVDAASALVREPDAPNAPVRFDEGECGNGDHGSAAQAPPNERGGNRYAGPNVHRATLLLYR
jgi:hypothetical protein